MFIGPTKKSDSGIITGRARGEAVVQSHPPLLDHLAGTVARDRFFLSPQRR